MKVGTFTFGINTFIYIKENGKEVGFVIPESINKIKEFERYVTNEIEKDFGR